MALALSRLPVALVVLGLGVILAGGLLLIDPFVAQPSLTVSSSRPAVFNVSALFSPSGHILVDVNWESTTPVWVIVFSCATFRIANGSCPGWTQVASQNGTSGSVQWSPKLGSTVVVGLPARPISGPQTGSASVHIRSTAPVLGTVLLISGVVALAFGVLLDLIRRYRPAPPPSPPPPAVT